MWVDLEEAVAVCPHGREACSAVCYGLLLTNYKCPVLACFYSVCARRKPWSLLVLAFRSFTVSLEQQERGSLSTVMFPALASGCFLWLKSVGWSILLLPRTLIPTEPFHPFSFLVWRDGVFFLCSGLGQHFLFEYSSGDFSGNSKEKLD